MTLSVIFLGVVLSTSHKEKRLKVQVSPASQKIITLEDVSDHSITSNEFSVWKSQWVLLVSVMLILNKQDSMQFEVISAETALEIRDNSEALRSTTIAPITVCFSCKFIIYISHIVEERGQVERVLLRQ